MQNHWSPLPCATHHWPHWSAWRNPYIHPPEFWINGHSFSLILPPVSAPQKTDSPSDLPVIPVIPLFPVLSSASGSLLPEYQGPHLCPPMYPSVPLSHYPDTKTMMLSGKHITSSEADQAALMHSLTPLLTPFLIFLSHSVSSFQSRKHPTAQLLYYYKSCFS